MQNEIALILTLLVAAFLFTRDPHSTFATVMTGAADPGPVVKKAWEDLLMFKKGGGSAPSPDPAIGAAALKEAQLGEEWLNFSREQFGEANKRQAEQDKIANEVTKQQLDASKQAQGWATADRDRYDSVFKPLQDDFIKTANNWDSAERQQQQASEAKADVLTNAAQQRGATQRQMAGMGVSPTSGRFAGIDRSQETATALAAAGAENTSRNQVRKEGVAMRGDAINLGSGLGVNPATSLGLSSQTGSAAMGTVSGNNAQAAGNASIMGQGYSGAMNGYGQQANIMQSQYNSQLSAWQSQQQASASASSGLMSGIGAVGGMAMVAF